MSDFFNQPDPQTPQQPAEPQSISLGEKEYTQEELSRLVGLGEQALDLESKWDTRIDRLMPAYNEVTQEKAQLAKRNAELEAQIQSAINEKAAEGGKLSPDEEARIVKEQAKRFGLVTAEDFDKYYEERRESERTQELADRLVKETESYLDKQASEGKPKASVRDVISFMDENGIGSYENAYKLKYEKELDDWKMKQITSNKPAGLYTQSSSTAGAKQPVERTVNSANLASVIEETLSRYQ